ncbi:MAG: diaminopimelate dehydrogenase [Clostridiales bacterium]|nr:diaminopimelate dehydrogenase [Clostridiales bacterium]
MQKIRVGIVGYGNLGKAVEDLVLQDNRFDLVCIFSKRNIKSVNAKTDFYENLHKYKNKIDILFLCGGSSSNLFEQALDCLKNFNTIDAFDTHKKIAQHIKNCNKAALQNNTIAFCCFGWDPGLFSLMRVLFKSLNKQTFTTWGKGVSQGHTEAIKNIKGVTDALQFTIPNQKQIRQIKCGKSVKNLNLHSRLCYVVADKNMQKYIANKIVNMPHYFKGYNTKVVFVNNSKLLKLKTFCHQGQVFTPKNELCFSLKTKSNPHITASVMLCYASLVKKFKKQQNFGAYSILDIPLSVFGESKEM